jgi:hypothetical protein
LESLSLKITELQQKASQQVSDLSHLSDGELLQRLSIYYRIGIELDLAPADRKVFDDVYNLLTEAGITPTNP